MNKEKGTVVNVTPLQTISDKFRKQDFTIKTFDEKYPQFLTFQVVNDKCDLVAQPEHRGRGRKLVTTFVVVNGLHLKA